jgi:hypothetical protein
MYCGVETRMPVMGKLMSLLMTSETPGAGRGNLRDEDVVREGVVGHHELYSTFVSLKMCEEGERGRKTKFLWTRRRAFG